MAWKKEFNPFDYQSGRNFRAILSHDYFVLIEGLRKKVSSDMFSFAVDVGNRTRGRKFTADGQFAR